MKNLKLFLLCFVFVTSIFTSCTNDDAIVEPQNTEQSESITTSLARLSQQFSSQGDMIPSANPTGNIVFDFGFDFVYPLNLSYNNGVTVTVNSFDELIEVLINSTADFYIDGIEFPFQIEYYNPDTDTIEIITINSEEEFIEFLEGLNWDEQDDCACYEVYDPVCVEVTDPSGVSFVITYPNDCYAFCDGFTEADFAENCEDDYNSPGGTECFSFNYPLTIITDDGTAVTVNSQTELDNALYNSYYFDFQYPFDVTLEDGTVVTVTSAQSFTAILEDCFGSYGPSDCEFEMAYLQDSLLICDALEATIIGPDGNLVDTNQMSFGNNDELVVGGDPAVADLGNWNIDCIDDQTSLTIANLSTFTLLNANWILVDYFGESIIFTNDQGYTMNIDINCNTSPCSECESLPYEPVCVEIDTPMGGTQIVVFPNTCYAECEGFTEADFVDCSENTSECTTEAVLEILFECPWVANDTATYVFNADGTVSISGSGLSTVGTWTIFMSENGYPIVSIEAEIGNFGDEWNFLDCNLINSLTVVSSLNPAGSVVISCN